MVTELLDGVFDLELGVESEAGTRTFHAAALETRTGLLLVDAGLPGMTGELADALDAAGYGLSDVSAVLFTHQDGDHAGGAHDLLERTDAVTMAHEHDAPAIDGRATPIKSGEDRYPPVPVDVELVGGVGVDTAAGRFEVVETPGHTPGHVSLYAPEERFLLAGDALTAEDGHLQGPVPKFTPDAEAAAESIRRLAAHEIDAALCYHGGYAETSSEEILEIAERV